MKIKIVENLSNLVVAVYGEDKKITRLAEALRYSLDLAETKMFSPPKCLSKLTAKRLKDHLNIYSVIMTDDYLWASERDWIDRTRMQKVDRLLSRDMIGERTSSLILVTSRSLADAYIERLLRLNYEIKKGKDIREGQAYFLKIKTGEMRMIPN